MAMAPKTLSQLTANTKAVSEDAYVQTAAPMPRSIAPIMKPMAMSQVAPIAAPVQM